MSETVTPAGVATCGNCGAPVAATEVVCPACGVLLAAYQAPSGSLGGSPTETGAVDAAPVSPIVTSPVEPIPAPPGPMPSSEPVRHVPSSYSPIDDALRQAHGEDVEAVALETSETLAGELAEMATDDSDLAREVDAELAGARVTFDGGNPVIVTDPTPQEPVPRPAPSPSATPQASAVSPAPPVAAEVAPAPRKAPPARPQRVAPPSPEPPARTTAPQVQPQASRSGNWLSIAVIVLVFLVVGRGLTSAGSFLALIFGVLMVIFLLRMATAMTGRKTTSMPWDETFRNTRRK